MTAVGVLTRRFLLDYGRNPVNLVVLILIPVVFVWVAAEPMADAAKLLGGTGRAVETATTGWAAAFLAALAMFFQVGQARSADRRLVLAGLPAPALVVARMSTGLLIAALASTAALATLFLRTAVDEPLRVAAGTMMFAVIYVGIGAAVRRGRGGPAGDPMESPLHPLAGVPGPCWYRSDDHGVVRRGAPQPARHVDGVDVPDSGPWYRVGLRRTGRATGRMDRRRAPRCAGGHVDRSSTTSPAPHAPDGCRPRRLVSHTASHLSNE